MSPIKKFMKKSRRKIILFAVILVLIAGVYYYSIAGRNVDVSGDRVGEQTPGDPNVSGKITDLKQEEILEGSSRNEVASGTNEKDPIGDGTGSQAELPKPTKVEAVVRSVFIDVPFMSQAPFGNWSDPRKQDGCEEAAVIMAMAWVRGETLSSKSVDDEINKIAAYEEETVGTFHDTSAFDTAETIFKGYFKYEKVEVRYRIKKKDIAKELASGNLVIVPTRGQLLGNPNYTPPGPVTHNLVVTGYDLKTKEFITNDPGTRNGKNYRYDENVLEDAIIDYPTGLHEKIEEEKTAMIIVKPLDK